MRTGGGGAPALRPVPPGGRMSTPGPVWVSSVAGSAGAAGAEAAGAGAGAVSSAGVSGVALATVVAAPVSEGASASATGAAVGAGSGRSRAPGAGAAGGRLGEGAFLRGAGCGAATGTAVTPEGAAAGGGGAGAMLRVLNTWRDGCAGLSQARGTPLSTSQCRASTRAVMKTSARRGILSVRGGAVRRCPRPGRWTAGPPPRAAVHQWRRPTRGRRWRWSPAW